MPQPIHLLALTGALPEHRLAQDVAKAQTRDLFAADFADLDRRLALFDNAGIAERRLCMPLAWYSETRGFKDSNARYVEHAERLSVDAAAGAIAEAGLRPEQIDRVVFVSSTGIATPSIEARIAGRLGLRADCQRTPVFGLGCAGGVLGLSRACDLARAEPGSRVLIVVVELCSLTLRLRDRSKANLVACALFGDGCAAAIVSTAAATTPALATFTAGGEHRWADTLDIMGWTVEDDGFGVLFAVAVPVVARQKMRAASDHFLAAHGLSRGDIDALICHPGGAKVIDALEHAFETSNGALDLSRDVLREYGNMSAVTVLFVLQRQLQRRDWQTGLMTSMGPGFTGAFQLVQRAP